MPSTKAKFYINQHGYFIQSPVDINPDKLVDTQILEDEAEAERLFRLNNGLDADEGVYIPELIIKDGTLFGSGLNTVFSEIEESSAEEYINNYRV